jgi:pSer/pThr/pTyr-binding forkhead associated (FHA) protein
VPLSDIEVSRRHAVIEVFGRRMLFLRDLGSTNGTYHNGRRISVARLRSGDTIGIGRSVLKLRIAH